MQEASVRQQCSGMMLQFILDYPLGSRRLQHHLQFLITNLSFEHESGRQAAVDTLKVYKSLFSIVSLTHLCLQLTVRPWPLRSHVALSGYFKLPLRRRPDLPCAGTYTLQDVNKATHGPQMRWAGV